MKKYAFLMLFAMLAMTSFAVTYPKKPYTGSPTATQRSMGTMPPAHRGYQSPATTSRSTPVAPSGPYSSYPTSGSAPIYGGTTMGGPRRIAGQRFAQNDEPNTSDFTGGEIWIRDGEEYYWNPETGRWEGDGETNLEDAGNPMPVGTPVLPLLLMAVAAMGLTYYRRRKTA